MGDGEGEAAGDLVEEKRENAAVRAQDIAEADDGPTGGAGFAEGEDGEFGEALGGSHEGVRRDGLVGGDEDEAVGVVVGGGLGEAVRAEGVVDEGGEGVPLHEGDVLEGGGVKDELGAVVVEEVVQQGAVGDAAENGGVWDCSGQVAVDLVEAVLGGVEEDEVGGICGGDGVGKGGADGAAGSGEQNALAGQGCARGAGHGGGEAG